MTELKSKPALNKNKVVDRRKSTPPKRRRDFSSVFKWTRLLGSAFLKFAYLIFGLILISLLFISGYEFLQQSPYVKLREITVTGIGPELKEELLEAANLNDATSLLSINLGQVKRTMEANSRVRSVELEKRYPHTLIIRGEEHKVRAVVFRERFKYVNQHGEIFKEVGPDEPLDYPIITGLPLQAEGGARVLLAKAINVLEALEPQKSPWSLRDLAELHFQDEDKLVLYFCSLPVAIEVRADELAEKLDDLKKVVVHLRKTGQWTLVRKIDLNYIEGIVVSYKKIKQPGLMKG